MKEEINFNSQKETRRAKENFTPQEIAIFRNEIEKYKIDGSFKIGSEFKYLEDKGIIKVYKWIKEWKEVKSMAHFEYGIKKEIEYFEVKNKLRIIINADGKRNYAKQMELKDYEKVAKTMPLSYDEII